jgi:hypothetical protein
MEFFKGVLWACVLSTPVWAAIALAVAGWPT